MTKISSSATSIALAIGLVVAFGGGVATAQGRASEKHQGATSTSIGNGNSHRPAGKVLTGTVTCSVHGTLVLSASGSMTVRANLTPFHGAACTASSGAKLRSGHFTSPLVFTATTTTTSSTSSTSTTAGPGCAPLPSGAIGDLTGGAIAWNPRPKAAASTGISFTGGSATTTTVNGQLVFQVTYSAGSVTSGSFTGSTGASLTMTSRQSVTQLQSHCESGKTEIAFTGTLSL